MIAIGNQTTRRAPMFTNSERLAHFCATQTRLTRVSRINLHEHAPSTFSLVREHKKKVGPSGIVHGLRKHAARHSFDVQVFNSDQAIIVDDLPRFLVVKISALIAHVIMKPLEKQYRFTPAIRAFLSAGNTPLQSPEFRLCVSKPARIVDLRTATKGGETRQANIHPNNVWAKRLWLYLHVHQKERVPSSGLTLHRKGFNVAEERAVQLNSHVAYSRQSQLAPVQRLSNLPKRQTVVSHSRTKARIAGFLTTPYATEESAKRQVHTSQYVFKYKRTDGGNVCPYGFKLGQLQALIKPGNSLVVEIPSVTPFLQRRIVEFAANCKLLVQYFYLSFGGIDTVAKCANHSPILLFKFSICEGNYGR